MAGVPAGIYTATYSNVPVYEYSQGSSIYVMRRRADDWINATHILKCAAYDKPARTRILEREVQKGVHEKVQGGYGKYQGTWIPLHDGRILAERNGVLDKLLPIFDFVPGERSPPPAPKHASTAASKPRAPRKSNNNRVPVAHQVPLDDGFDRASMSQYPDDGELDNMTIVSESMMDDDQLYNPQYTNPRKRKRADQMPIQDQQHQIWADALLDYFMLLESEDPFPAPPSPPPGINIDKPIDDKGHTALHWAAAMGDIDVVKDLISRHARIECASNNLETPLMRAVLFTNNYDKQSMAKLVRILAPTVTRTDWFGSTVFHHIAATTSSKNKYLSARYYLDTIISVLSETWIADEVTRLLNIQDQNGDTAIMIAARNGARKCVRSLLGRHVAVDQPNGVGETADDLIRDLNARRQRHIQANGRGRDGSSSPYPFPDGINGVSSSNPIALPHVAYRSQTATTLMSRIAPSFLERFKSLATALESEYEEKSSEASEAERVAKKRILEFESLKRQVAEMEGAGLWREVEDTIKKEEDERENQELASLIQEAEGLIEIESRDELRSILASMDGSLTPTASFSQDQSALSANGYPPVPSQQGQNQFPQAPHANGVPNGMPMAPMMANMGGDQTSSTALAAKLTTAQRERQRLVRETVLAMSVAGLGERQADYKRLIYAALGDRSSSSNQNGGGIGGMDLDLEREGVLDDILRELEEERRIAMAEQADGGEGDGENGGEESMTGATAGLELIDPAMEAASMSMIEPAFTLVEA